MVPKGSLATASLVALVTCSDALFASPSPALTCGGVASSAPIRRRPPPLHRHALSADSSSPGTAAGGGRNGGDSSTLSLIEHVNLNVPTHDFALPFYLDLLGCGLDPRRAANVAAGAGTVWPNCGASQFHLPVGEVAQVLPGHIGLRYNDLAGLKGRIRREEDGKAECDRCFASSETAVGGDGREVITLVDRYGNMFQCREGATQDPPSSGGHPAMAQPLVRSGETELYGDGIAEQYGLEGATDCRGIDYVEFKVPRGAADKIRTFYDCVFDAPTAIVTDASGGGGGMIAIVGIGSVDEMGRANQSLLFRECDDKIPPYDGHHLSLYVGSSQADFETAFLNCEQAGVIWANPRFKDEALTLEGAREWSQFRFKDIVDLRTGMKVFELEHEIRSIKHDAWLGIDENE